jgi:hypothetical protein
MMKKIILIAGIVMALSGSAFANEEADEAKLALIQQCTQGADDAGLEDDDRQAYIDSCVSEYQQKTPSEES